MGLSKTLCWCQELRLPLSSERLRMFLCPEIGHGHWVPDLFNLKEGRISSFPPNSAEFAGKPLGSDHPKRFSGQTMKAQSPCPTDRPSICVTTPWDALCRGPAGCGFLPTLKGCLGYCIQEGKISVWWFLVFFPGVVKCLPWVTSILLVNSNCIVLRCPAGLKDVNVTTEESFEYL